MLTAVVLAVILGRGAQILLRDPCVGVADNLDFWRVSIPAGIVVEPQRQQGFYVLCRYELGEPQLSSWLSSAAILAWAARALAPVVSPVETGFDLRQIGVLYWLASAAVLGWAFWRGPPRCLLVLVAWVLVDPGFLLFFNSLYADSAMIVGVLAVVCAIPLAGLVDDAGVKRHVPAALSLLAVAAIVAGFSKMQYSPFPLALLGVILATLGAHARWPRRGEWLLLGVLAATAVAAPLHFFRGSGPRFIDANNYNALFGGIAQVASDPPAALARLGIPDEHLGRPAVDYFVAAVGEDDPVLPAVRRLSRSRLAMAYLGDRSALRQSAERIEVGLRSGLTHQRGNHVREESAGRPRAFLTPEQFASWRWYVLHPRLPTGAAWAFLALLTLHLGYRAATRSWTSLDAVMLFLLVWCGGQAATAVLGEGFVNLLQHLLGARLALDLLLVVVLYRMLAAAVRRSVHRLRPVRPPTAAPKGPSSQGSSPC